MVKKKLSGFRNLRMLVLLFLFWIWLRFPHSKSVAEVSYSKQIWTEHRQEAAKIRKNLTTDCGMQGMNRRDWKLGGLENSEAVYFTGAELFNMLCYMFFVLIWRVIFLYKNIQSN